jgi:hypothetical protein
MINWDLVKHPLNWIIILLMLIIAGTAGHLLLTHFGAEPSSGAAEPAATLPPGEESKTEIAAAVLG